MRTHTNHLPSLDYVRETNPVISLVQPKFSLHLLLLLRLLIHEVYVPVWMTRSNSLVDLGLLLLVLAQVGRVLRVSHVNYGQKCALILIAVSPHGSHHINIDASRGICHIRQADATSLHIKALLVRSDGRLARHVVECLRLVLVCELLMTFELGG